MLLKYSCGLHLFAMGKRIGVQHVGYIRSSLSRFYVLMFILLNSHVHLSIVTYTFVPFFWINLLLKMQKYITIQKRDRFFSLASFVSMLEPNIFRKLTLNDGVKDMVNCYTLLFCC